MKKMILYLKRRKKSSTGQFNNLSKTCVNKKNKINQIKLERIRGEEILKHFEQTNGCPFRIKIELIFIKKIFLIKLPNNGH